MNSDLAKLIVLQQHDVVLRALRDEIAAVPRRVAEHAARSAAAQARKIALEESLAKEEKLRRGQESDVRDLQQKIAKVQRQLDMATTTVQVNAFEHEVVFLKSEIARLEDAELESMERTEKLENERIQAVEVVVDTEAALERERLRAADVLARDEGEVKTHEAQRSALRVEVDESMLSQYDRIAKAKGTAVAEGVDHKCSACQMMVRNQKWNELCDRSNDAIFICDTCGRLLYWDPARDAPVKKGVETASPVTSALRAEG